MGKRVDIAKRLEELGCDPVEGMVRIAQAAEENKNPTLAAHILGELLQYTAPKLKAMEFSIEPDTMQFLDRQARLNRIRQLVRETQIPIEGAVIEQIMHTPEDE